MSAEAVQNWRVRTKERMIEAMGGECQCCGYNKCKAALEFHHIDMAKKEFNFAVALKNPSSWPKLVVELRKCVLLCANCHREVHHDELVLPIKAKSFNEEFLDYSKKSKEDELDNCPICGTVKSKHLATCSRRCAGKSAGKVDWENLNLPELMSTYGNAEQVGKFLGVSGAAVRKQLIKQSKVIAGFCGVGKTTICNDTDIVELECYKFRGPDFPTNYVKAIIKARTLGKTVLISTDREVLLLLRDKGIKVTEVFPSKELKEEYLLRYKDRGSHSDFITTIDMYWDIWIQELMDNTTESSIKLHSGEFLKDVI